MNHQQNINISWDNRKKNKAMRWLMTSVAFLVIATTITTIAAKIVHTQNNNSALTKDISNNQYPHQYDFNPVIHNQELLQSTPRFLKNKNKNNDDDDNDDGSDDDNSNNKKKKKKKKKKNNDDKNENSYPSSYGSSYGNDYGGSSYGSSSYGNSYRNNDDEEVDDENESNTKKGSFWSLGWLFGGNIKSNDDYTTSKYRSSAYGNYGTGYGYSSSASSGSYSSYGSGDEDVGAIVLIVFFFFVSTLCGMLYTAHSFTQHPEGTFVNCCLLSLNSADMFYRIAYNVYNCRLAEVVDIICPGEDDDDYTEEELERMKLRPGIERVLDKEHLKAMRNMELEMGNYEKKKSWKSSFGM